MVPMSEAARTGAAALREPEGPNPREVWAAASHDRVMTIHVQPDHSGTPITFTGHVTDRRKVGDAHNVHVEVTLTPFGEVAPVEVEATKEGGQWGPFHAFHWTEDRDPRREEPYTFQHVGKVVGVEIEGAGEF